MRGLFLALMLAATPLLAQEDVELELVLLADASGSIDEDEVRFQRRGYAEAIVDEAVLSAIANSAYGRIAVTYVEWAANQAVVVPWTIIDGRESATAFAEALLEPPRQAYGRNAIGAALLEGKRLIERNEHEGWRKVIDFSGDSANNYSGPSIKEARQEVLDAGITINALAVLCRFCNGRPRQGLEERYESRVIGGQGAFVVTAEGPGDFMTAVRRKLILEISGRMPDRDVAAADRQSIPTR